jgi:hypothetical protein
MAAMTYSLQKAVNMSMMKKMMHQDAQSIQNIVEMSKDIAKITGTGQNLDIKV